MPKTVEVPSPYFLVIGSPDTLFVRTINKVCELCYEPQGGVGVLPDGQVVQAMRFNHDRWLGQMTPDVVKALMDIKDAIL